MKKSIYLIMTLLLTIFMTGCFSEKKVSEDDFNKILTENDYTVVDYTSTVDEFPGEKMYFATNNNGYAITLMTFKNSDEAMSAYETIINNVKEESAKVKTAKGNNYNKQIVESDKNYYLIYRIDNEVIMTYGSASKKDDINSALKLLGL